VHRCFARARKRLRGAEPLELLPDYEVRAQEVGNFRSLSRRLAAVIPSSFLAPQVDPDEHIGSRRGPAHTRTRDAPVGQHAGPERGEPLPRATSRIFVPTHRSHSRAGRLTSDDARGKRVTFVSGLRLATYSRSRRPLRKQSPVRQAPRRDPFELPLRADGAVEDDVGLQVRIALVEVFDQMSQPSSGAPGDAPAPLASDNGPFDSHPTWTYPRPEDTSPATTTSYFARTLVCRQQSRPSARTNAGG